MRNSKELIQRVLWSLGLVLIAETGKALPLPLFFIEKGSTVGDSIFEKFLSSTSGGQLSTPALFSLGMSPYMTSLIIWSTITMIDSDRINNLSAKQRSFLQKLLLVAFAGLQALALSFRFKQLFDLKSFPEMTELHFFLISTLLLTAGALFLAWLSDINTEKGIGAQALFILPGLLSNLPRMLISGQVDRKVWTAPLVAGLIAISLVFIVVTLFMYKAELRIKVERTGVDSRLTDSYIPIKVLTSGAMPFMFAITVFSLPQLLLLNPAWSNTWFSKFLADFFSFSTIVGILNYGLVIFLLGLGFSFINVRPHDIAKNLKRSGDYVFDVMPGDPTEDYFKQKLLRVSFVGNCYLVLVSLVPLFIGLKFNFVSNLAFYFGSLFMVISILDTLIKEIRFNYFKSQYEIF